MQALMKSITRNISGWGRYPVQNCQLFRPEKYQDLLPQLTSSIAYGNGRSYGDAALNDQGAVILTERLNRFLAFDKSSGILRAEAGVTLKEILSVIIPAGWFLPVTPGTQFATLGGCVAVDAHGKNHHHVGTLGQHVLSLDLITSTHDTISCSPQQHAEIFWATIGGMGLTGFIGTVTLQLQPLPSTSMVVKNTAATNLEQAIKLLSDPSADDQYSVAWIDCLAGGENLGRSIIMTAHHAKIDELPAEQRLAPLSIPHHKIKKMPFDFPGWILNSTSVRLFNQFYYQRHAQRTEPYLQEYAAYFYPLDKILEWNRLYGKQGFVQYQCVIPTAHTLPGLQQLLEKLSHFGGASFLAVLKRFGASNQGLLSFPIPGFTLALDIPMRNQSTLQLLNELDEIVLHHQGRVYLAKDARLSPDTFRKMYPQFPQWLAIKKMLDPHNQFTSSLARRLQMMEAT